MVYCNFYIKAHLLLSQLLHDLTNITGKCKPMFKIHLHFESYHIVFILTSRYFENRSERLLTMIMDVDGKYRLFI